MAVAPERLALMKSLLHDWTPHESVKTWIPSWFHAKGHQVVIAFQCEYRPLEKGSVFVMVEPAARTNSRSGDSGRLQVRYKTRQVPDSLARVVTESVSEIIRRNERSIPLHRLFDISGPAASEYENVEIRVNKKCNERCVFCNSAQGFDDYYEGPAQVRVALKKMAGPGPQRLTITGMEPTLDEALVSYIRIARELGYEKIGLQTNGLRSVDPDYCRKLVDAGLDLVTISLHAVDPEISRTITGVSRDRELTLRAMENYLNLGVEVEAQVVICRMNLQEVRKVIEKCADLHRRYGDRKQAEWFYRQVEHFRFREEREPGSEPPGDFHFNSCFSLVLSTVAPTFGTPDLRERVIPDYNQMVECLGSAIAAARDHLVPVSIPRTCSPPLCILGDLRFFVGEYRARQQGECPSTHVKPSICRDCRLEARCNGAWKGHAQLFGIGEMIRRSRKFRS